MSILTIAIITASTSLAACSPRSTSNNGKQSTIDWVFLYGLDNSLCVASSKDNPPIFIRSVSRCEIVNDGQHLLIVKRDTSEYRLYDGAGSVVLASPTPFGVLGFTIISSKPLRPGMDAEFIYKQAPIIIREVDHRWSDSGLLWIQDDKSRHWLGVSSEGVSVAGPYEHIDGFSDVLCQYRKPGGRIGVLDTRLEEMEFESATSISGPFSAYFSVHYSSEHRTWDEIWRINERIVSFEIGDPVSYEITATGTLVGYLDGGGNMEFSPTALEWEPISPGVSQATEWRQSQGHFAFFSDDDVYFLKTAELSTIFSTDDIGVGVIHPIFVNRHGWSIHQSDDFRMYLIVDPRGNVVFQFSAS